MTPDEFRRQATRSSSGWPATWSRSRTCRCSRGSTPGEVRAAAAGLAARARPRPGRRSSADLDRVVVPGHHPLAVAELLRLLPGQHLRARRCSATSSSSGLGVQGMLWSTSPACTELETHVLDWLAELLGLPERFRSTGAGRWRDPGRRRRAPTSAPCWRRVSGPAAVGPHRRLVALHLDRRPTRRSRRASASPACAPTSCALVDVDDDFAAATRTRSGPRSPRTWPPGCVPFFVVRHRRHHVVPRRSTRWPPIADVCRGRRARGCTSTPRIAGSAAVVPELRCIHDGLERVDSYCLNPHKWLFTELRLRRASRSPTARRSSTR